MPNNHPSPAQRHVRVYALSRAGLQLTPLTGPTLDAVSLQLPEGVYTTLRTYDQDRILGLGAHLQRLADSQALLGSERRLDLTGLRAGLRQALDRAALPEARVRLTVPLAPGQAEDEALISLEPFDPFPAEHYTHGVRCATRPMERDTPRAKHTRAIARGQAARSGVRAEQAARPEIHEVLRVDTAGHVLEGLSSNFFAVLNGTLHTAREGVLLGVTRSLVLALSAGLAPVAEQPVTLDELRRAPAAEAFITSASREVMPVVQIDADAVGAGQPGPVTRQLLARYREHARLAAEKV
jgi:branched-chain amino acid aminotransferase